VQVEVTSTRSVITSQVPAGQRLRIPINHFEGNYTCDKDTLADLRADDRVVLRYVDNPNGSVDDIAGICNPAGNVVGLMPHPERATNALLGSVDGSLLLRSLLNWPLRRGAAAVVAPTRSQPCR
jgi:phosphoribosylformylglycinamidine synthase